MSEDWLQLDDETSRERSPAFTTSPPAGQAELLAIEWQHRNSGAFPGADDVLFTRLDEEGAEVWDTDEEQERWQVLMAWPRLPSIEETMAFKANAEARLEAAHWDALRAAVAKDEATGQPRPSMPSRGVPRTSAGSRSGLTGGRPRASGDDLSVLKQN